MGKVVHFEIPTEDLDRAKGFYSAVFGWQLDTSAMPGGGQYTSAMSTPVDEQTQMPTEPGSINGGMMQRDETTPHPVITIGVDSIDQALHDVEAKGGATVLARTAIPGMGAYAYFTDSEGNVMGLWETAAPGPAS
jgi:predicted enzyme related to lactoylglutathione lyase